MASGEDDLAKAATLSELKAAVERMLDEIEEQIGAIATGLLPAGAWDAQAGSFPRDAMRGSFYVVSAGGTVDGQSFAIGDWLLPLRPGASPTTYAGNWLRWDYSKIVPKAYATPGDLQAGDDAPRGAGQLWRGGPFLYQEADATTRPDFSNRAGTPFLHLGRESERVDIRRHGAIENTDCTKAIDSALAVAMEARQGKTDGPDGMPQASGPALYIPAGRWHYDGAGFQSARQPDAGSSIAIFGQGRSQSMLICQSDSFFLTLDRITAVTMRDFAFLGGKGLLAATNAEDNVTYGMFIENLVIEGFSDCAIGHDARDFPNIQINHCQIRGDGKSARYCLCLPGLTDEVLINNNTLGGARYLIALGKGGNNAKITNNGLFGRSFPGEETADIWIETRPKAINSGQGLIIENNKFGPEWIRSDSVHRILFADTDPTSGKYRWEQSHQSAASEGVVTATRITKNLFGGRRAARKSLIYSTTPNLPGLWFDPSNTIVGFEPDCILEFSPDLVARQRGSDASRISTGGGLFAASAPARISNKARPPRPANIPGAIQQRVPDLFYEHLGGVDIIAPGSGAPDGADYLSLLSDLPSAHSIQQAATVAAGIDDPFGGTAAIRISPKTGKACHYSSEDLSARIKGSGLLQGSVIWARTWMRSAGAARAFVALVVDDTVPELVFPVRVEGPVWQEVLVPFNLQRAGFSKGSARLRIGTPAVGSDTGALDLFGAELFAARAPVHGGNLRTFGAKAGAWDGPHLILGTWHFWVDEAGELRRKAGAPKDASDGKVVGTV